MPDMSIPGAHYADLWSHFSFKAQECRTRADQLNTEASVYADAARRLKDAMDEEADKQSSRDSVEPERCECGCFKPAPTYPCGACGRIAVSASPVNNEEKR